MGRTYSLGHTVRYISKGNYTNDLVDLIDFDEDLNGNNGHEYISEEAIKKGYDSDLEFKGHEAIGKFGESRKAIEYLIDETIGSQSYYHDVQYDIIEQETMYIVSIAYMSGS
jgi:hypothetical protein